MDTLKSDDDEESEEEPKIDFDNPPEKVKDLPKSSRISREQRKELQKRRFSLDPLHEGEEVEKFTPRISRDLRLKKLKLSKKKQKKLVKKVELKVAKEVIRLGESMKAIQHRMGEMAGELVETIDKLMEIRKEITNNRILEPRKDSPDNTSTGKRGTKLIKISEKVKKDEILPSDEKPDGIHTNETDEESDGASIDKIRERLIEVMKKWKTDEILESDEEPDEHENFTEQLGRKARLIIPFIILFIFLACIYMYF